jgi:hypothetical protein
MVCFRLVVYLSSVPGVYSLPVSAFMRLLCSLNTVTRVFTYLLKIVRLLENFLRLADDKRCKPAVHQIENLWSNLKGLKTKNA